MVLDMKDDTSTYSLHLTAQPGTLGRTTNVRVKLPPDQMFVRASMPPTSLDGNLVTFEIPLREDTDISVVMRSVGDAVTK